MLDSCRCVLVAHAFLFENLHDGGDNVRVLRLALLVTLNKGGQELLHFLSQLCDDCEDLDIHVEANPLVDENDAILILYVDGKHHQHHRCDHRHVPEIHLGRLHLLVVHKERVRKLILHAADGRRVDVDVAVLLVEEGTRVLLVPRIFDAHNARRERRHQRRLHRLPHGAELVQLLAAELEDARLALLVRRLHHAARVVRVGADDAHSLQQLPQLPLRLLDLRQGGCRHEVPLRVLALLPAPVGARLVLHDEPRVVRVEGGEVVRARLLRGRGLRQVGLDLLVVRRHERRLVLQRGGDREARVHAAQQHAVQEKLAQLRVQGQVGQVQPQRRQPAVRPDRADAGQRVPARLDGGVAGRLDGPSQHLRVRGLAEVQHADLQQQVLQRHAGHLALLERRHHLVVRVAGVEPQAVPGADTAGTSLSLLRVGAADPAGDEAVHALLGRVAVLLVLAGVEDEDDVVDGDGGLGDVGGEHDLPLGLRPRRVEDCLLLLVRHGGVQAVALDPLGQAPVGIDVLVQHVDLLQPGEEDQHCARLLGKLAEADRVQRLDDELVVHSLVVHAREGCDRGLRDALDV
eukprot:Rhum_TRINITY_DN14423_c2_g1::Rhum_TRINITY_DN14423_c2_g1_i1::g.88930::m.88930